MAASKRGGPRSGQRPPDGKVRLSQVVTTFGPGSMVDLLDHAVLVGGTDFWRYDKLAASPRIDEPRLYAAVARRLDARGIHLDPGDAFRRPPPGDDQEPSPGVGIQVVEFPTWFVCQTCRALQLARNLERDKQRYVHRCGGTRKGHCVPVRFVATCPKGHLEEFPWIFFHADPEKGTCDGTELFLEEDASGDLSQIMVACRACEVRKPLSTAREPKALPLCRGERPWLGWEGREEKGCDQHLHLLVRTASSATFTQSMSALSIPEKSLELQNKVTSSEVWSVVKEVTRDDLPTLRKVVPALRRELDGYTDDEVMAAIERIRTGKDPERLPIRTAEYEVFRAQPVEIPGTQPPPKVDFHARRLPESETPLPDLVERVVLAKKLRQVRAQIGLTRLSGAMPNLQGDYEDASRLQPVGLTTSWLPATEIFGEGVLLVLKEGAVVDWERRVVEAGREKVLQRGFDREYAAGGGPEWPGVRFYMLHSLAHLLIASISLTCGYAAASISERIYCARATDPVPMAAILLMTGSPGSEGTLGGLVEQGRDLRSHLRRAWDMASLCSNDPVCAQHEPGGNAGRHLEGAACHGCLFIAESACERFNRSLDRALVVPTMGHEHLAFFQARP